MRAAMLSVLPMRRPATITVVLAPIKLRKALGLVKVNFLPQNKRIGYCKSNQAIICHKKM